MSQLVLPASGFPESRAAPPQGRGKGQVGETPISLCRKMSFMSLLEKARLWCAALSPVSEGVGRCTGLRMAPDLDSESFHGQEVAILRARISKELKERGGGKWRPRNTLLSARSQVVCCVASFLVQNRRAQTSAQWKSVRHCRSTCIYPPWPAGRQICRAKWLQLAVVWTVHL